ncbi:NAD(P)-binding domain-containing protein [Paenibacillus sp. ATY16]|uniref:NADPH-dependent F420 reductase n=1 Tax=Paenibacillus sp. ATY16 TaxID=1759312 RepID=UPI00200C55F8|nr:NAD(P)-binding domain-containing protein [Paenibacillus sp. ATY16]MCK9858618.1 NAD(P)-binding domain-containing protein [Paenibacillus sp. ATY16]
MKIGFIGSGNVGQTLGHVLVEQGHDVKLGARQPAKLTNWKQSLGNSELASVGTYREAAEHGELVINATPGVASLEVLQSIGQKSLAGKILIDVALPLEFTNGELRLSVAPNDSLGEQIQQAFPETKVVKTLNTVTSALMINPLNLAEGQHDMFIGGNDTEAKNEVSEYLRQWFGWKNIIDLGDISSARATEGLLLLTSRIYGALGHSNFNLKIIR